MGKLICTERNYVLFAFCQLSFNPSHSSGFVHCTSTCVHCTREWEAHGWDVGEQECDSGRKVRELLSSRLLFKVCEKIVSSNWQFKKKRAKNKHTFRFVGTLCLLMQGVFHIVFCRQS